jgi:hypothetical protein
MILFILPKNRNLLKITGKELAVFKGSEGNCYLLPSLSSFPSLSLFDGL